MCVWVRREYASMRAKAEKAGAEFDCSADIDMNDGDVKEKKQLNSTICFYRTLRHVIEQSDVIIEVLDSRDPQSCRNLDIERQIVADGKKLILLLNKIDLIPK